MGHHALIDIYFDLYSSQRSRNDFSHRTPPIPFISSYHHLYFLHFFSKRGLEVLSSFRCRSRFHYKENILGKLFAFSGGFLFLGFVQPYFSYDRKYVLWAAAFLIPFFLFSVYIPVLTFGQATSATTFLPYVVAVDAININWLMFDRVTMFFLLSLISFIMLYLALVSWKTIRILSHYFPSIKPVKLLLALSAAVYFSCFLIPDWKDVEKLFWWNTFLRFYILIAIPFSIFFFGRRMKRKGKNETI